MRQADGAWVGWTGVARTWRPSRSTATACAWCPVGLTAQEVADYYEGFSNDTLWPLYHDVISPPEYHRHWWDAYRRVNRRFAEAAAEQAARRRHGVGARLPAPAGPGDAARAARPTCGSATSTTSRSRPLEIFAQLPWRRQVRRGPARGRPRRVPARRATRPTSSAWSAGSRTCTRGPDRSRRPTPGRSARCGPPPSRSRSTPPGSTRWPAPPRCGPAPRRSARTSGDPTCCCSASTGSTTPRASGTGSRPSASCSRRGGCEVPGAALVQVASPSRENVEAYQQLRDEVELARRPDQRRVRPDRRRSRPLPAPLLPARRRWRRCTGRPTSCSSRRCATA